LIGKTEQTDIYLTLTITDAPQGEAHPDIFLLVEQEPGGQIDPIDWDYAENGVCIDDQTAEAYGIEKALAEIQSKYPCTADD
ncbi:MAG TPA: hypothetical protein VLW75_00040, partial [Rhizomicrobium sp.]|nr:hypothetical protein [Rhizomicrobium sp.]